MFNRHSTDAVNALLYPFINAAGGEDNFMRYEIGALSEMADALLQFNLWDKFIAIYPFIGGKSTTCRLNFKNINRYNISWNNSWWLQFDKNGVTSLGGDGYGNTNIPLRFAINNIQNVHIAAYNRTDIKNIDGDGRMIGVNTLDLELDIAKMGAYELNFGTNGGIIGLVYNKINTLGGFGYLKEYMIKNNISGKGFMIGQNNSACYLNGKIFGEWFPALVTEVHPQNNKTFLLFGNRSIPFVNSSAKNLNLSFVSVGYALNKIEMYNYINIVENFQKAMSRSVM